MNKLSKSMIIYPSTTSLVASQTWLPPKSWTMFIPTELLSKVRCDGSCHREDPNNITPILEIWKNTYSKDLKRKMAHYLSLIKSGVHGILLSSDPLTLNNSIGRLLHDNEPNGVVGLEYFGKTLTSDSYHFHYRSRNEFDVPCQYRLRHGMIPLWTLGVRCRSTSVDNGNIQSLTLTDYRSPPVFSSYPTFGVDNVLDAFFDRNGMWALITTLHPGGTTTSMWSLWAQRMLQEIPGEMAVTSLTCSENRGNTKVSLEPSEETKKAFGIVNQWQCKKEKSFYDCAKILADEMQNKSLFESSDVTLLNQWLDSLKQDVGYTEPKRVSKETPKEDAVSGCVIHSPSMIKPKGDNPKPDNLFPNISPKCQNISRAGTALDPFADYVITKPSKTNDLALVVIFFDSSIYKNIPYLQDLHAKYFPVIVYCGPRENVFREFQKLYNTPLSFIEVAPTSGYYAFECVTRAMMMNYDVRGYLEIPDDVVLNAWNLGQTPRDQFWWQWEVGMAERNATYIKDPAIKNPVPWWPWNRNEGYYGYQAIANVWNYFKDVEEKQKGTRAQEIVTSFKKILWTNSGNKDGIFYMGADIFYVPAKFRQSWCMLSDIFFRYHVFLEIAVPTLIHGLDLYKNVFQMDGYYLWYGDRPNYRKFYNSTHHFLHPWKLGAIADVNHATFLCEDVLPHIVKDRT